MFGFVSQYHSGYHFQCAAKTADGAGHVLLLQGPVGPFFSRLQDHFIENGLNCLRVSFNAGDRLFSRRRGRIDFAGSLPEWADWLSAHLRRHRVACIVLFGAERPVHAVARQQAKLAGVPVVSLEEGYVRPGFVTVEWDGNNAASPLAGQLPPDGATPPQPQKGTDYHGFRPMCLFGAAYYTTRQAFSAARERELFHRRMCWPVESFFWIRNFWRFQTRRAGNFRAVERLLEHYDRKYFLVPLQVSADSQLAGAAAGWTNRRLIAETLQSFARAADPDCRLVFKVHPLERGHGGDRKFALRTASALGVADRVDVLEVGSIGLLTRHSAGMITINSTSGLSAISHGVPLMVLGKAIYRHPMLVTAADTTPDFDAFWNGGFVADAQVRNRYLAWLRSQSLRPGDFYAAEGIPEACRSVLEKVNEMRALIPAMETDIAAC